MSDSGRTYWSEADQAEHDELVRAAEEKYRLECQRDIRVKLAKNLRQITALEEIVEEDEKRLAALDEELQKFKKSPFKEGDDVFVNGKIAIARGNTYTVIFSSGIRISFEEKDISLAEPKPKPEPDNKEVFWSGVDPKSIMLASLQNKNQPLQWAKDKIKTEDGEVVVSPFYYSKANCIAIAEALADFAKKNK